MACSNILGRCVLGGSSVQVFKLGIPFVWTSKCVEYFKYLEYQEVCPFQATRGESY